MKNILLDFNENIPILTINREKYLNAMNFEMLNEIWEVLNDKRILDFGALIITGTGKKAFIAGADINEMNSLSNKEMLKFLDLGQKITDKIENIDLVTIAAVNGYALGGGFEIALSCDLIFASENAKFGLPEVSLGIIPGFGGTQRLSRYINKRLAKEYIFSGKIIDSAYAKDLHIINEIYKIDELLIKSKEYIKGISNNSLFSIKQAKRSINKGSEISISEALELEKQICAICFAAEDRKEGMKAFIEKRAPKFNQYENNDKKN
jgi:enoyl-CoA hydratase